MADNTNPQVILFSKEKSRVAANKIVQLRNFLEQMNDEYVAQGIGALCPSDDDPIDDGAATDGRPINTNNNLTGQMYNIGEILSAINTHIATSMKICNLPNAG